MNRGPYTNLQWIKLHSQHMRHKFKPAIMLTMLVEPLGMSGRFKRPRSAALVKSLKPFELSNARMQQSRCIELHVATNSEGKAPGTLRAIEKCTTPTCT